jgi:hypothetical protein
VSTIVGSSIGGVALLIVLWALWRCTMSLRVRRWAGARAEARAKTIARTRARTRARTNGAEMNCTRAMVERRPDSRTSEPPPAYHEVVRDGGRVA